jgi:hypothetical protein
MFYACISLLFYVQKYNFSSLLFKKNVCFWQLIKIIPDTARQRSENMCLRYTWTKSWLEPSVRLCACGINILWVLDDFQVINFLCQWTSTLARIELVVCGFIFLLFLEVGGQIEVLCWNFYCVEPSAFVGQLDQMITYVSPILDNYL